MIDPIKTLLDEEVARLAEARESVAAQITTLHAQITEHEAQLATIAAKHDYVQDLAGRFKKQLQAIAKRAANP